MSKNDEAVSEDGDASPETEPKSKKGSKKGKGKRSHNENNRENGESNRKSSAKVMSVSLNRLETEDDEESEDSTDTKVPLLDQPAVIEGNRSRKTIERFEQKDIPVPKRSSKVQIPNGRGKALGRITNVLNRLKKLDDSMIKQLHRALFGRSVGKTNELMNNILLFRGFLFDKDSEDYKSKIIDFSEKFALSEMRSLMYAFDLDAKYKSKDEAVTFILDFLLCPQPSKVTKPTLEGHPKRKATKRNYFEADLTFDESRRKKKKKKKASSEEAEKSDSSEKTTSSKQTSKSKKNADVEETDEQLEKADDSDADKDNESKKPAKKRKRNQVIDENEEEEEPVSSNTNDSEKPAKDVGKKKSRSKRG